MALKTVEKICLNCNKKFNGNYYDHLKGMANFCSKDCHNNYRRENAYKTGARVIKNCKYCGKVFNVNFGELTKGGGKFCSAVCSTNYNSGPNNVRYKDKILKKCLECGKKIYVHQSHVERVKFCSRVCSGRNLYKRKGQLNMGVQRGKGGKRADLNDMYFRSSWEANYARYLNFLLDNKEIKCWEYEPETFEFKTIKRGTRFYTPDFLIKYNNGTEKYIEVKGWMDQKSKTRLKRFKKYFPDKKLEVVDKSWFRKNGNTLSKLIKNWENNY